VTQKIETQNFLENLGRFARVRVEVADALANIARTLNEAEKEGQERSGKLELERDIALEGTGFPEFFASLNTFLTQERAIAELRQARTLARQICDRTKEAVARRIPLLEQDITQLKQKIDSVEPEFQMLDRVRDNFLEEIGNTRDRKAKTISDSFSNFVFTNCCF
jgi:phage shock protein A